jgi:hypothetical protein
METDDFKKFDHQPGYTALRASATTCALCSALLNGLEFPDLEREMYRYLDLKGTQKTAEKTGSRAVQDIIRLQSPPVLSVPDRSFLRFKIMWRTIDPPLFSWSGAVFGLSKGSVESLSFLSPFKNGMDIADAAQQVALHPDPSGLSKILEQ